MPKVYDQLMGIRQKLESHYKEMQDIEFTCRTAPCTCSRPGPASGPGRRRADRRRDGPEGLIDERRPSSA
jgi:pyruvate,orthophosphate dikinase